MFSYASLGKMVESNLQVLFLGKVKAEGDVKSLPDTVDKVVSEFFGREMEKEEMRENTRVMEQDKEMNPLQDNSFNRTMLFQVQLFVQG